MTQIADRNWVTQALNFWLNTTPKECGKSRKLIRWNIETLTKALDNLPPERRSA
jgi:hypothetical protein